MERVCGVVRFYPGAINVRNNFKVGSIYEMDSSGGAIALREIPSSPLMGLSQAVYDNILHFLSMVFMDPDEEDVKTNLQKYWVTPRTRRGFRDAISGAIEGVIDSLRPSTLFRSRMSDSRARHIEWLDYWKYELDPLLQYAYVGRYLRGHSAMLLTPSQEYRATGWTQRQPLSIIERDDGTYLIRVATEEEQKYLMMKKPITDDGIVRGGRYLYLTEKQRAALNIGPELHSSGVDLKFTIDMVNEHTITVEPLSPADRSLPTIPTSPFESYYDTVRVVRRHVGGPIVLPAAFCRKYAIQQDDTLKTETLSKKFIIYGHKRGCDICGGEIDTKYQTVPICPDCANILPDVRDTVKSAGSLKMAIPAAEKELTEAMEKLKKFKGGII